MRFLNKNILILGVVLTAIVGGIFILERPHEAVACTFDADNIYNLSYEDADGNCHTLGALKDDVTVINVWASWCPFCVEEMPDLARLAQQDGVSVVAINRGESVEDAEEFLTSLNLVEGMHILYDPGEEFYRYIEGFGMPETVFVDAEGTIQFHKRGVMSFEEMQEVISLISSRVQPHAEVENEEKCLAHSGNSCTL